MLVLKLISLVLFCSSLPILCNSKPSLTSAVDVCSLWSSDWQISTTLRNHIYTNVKIAGGPSAGKFSRVKVNTRYECVAQCCQFNRCNLAYWISSTCLHVECLSDDLCQPVEGDQSDNVEDTLFVRVRSVQSTAAAIDYEDPGHDECNRTSPCATNERCEKISINAQLTRQVCLCDREKGFRRINGVCRQYLSGTKPCALYEKGFLGLDYVADDDNNRGLCSRNEECLPPNDRAKHGYCQCKLGYLRPSESDRCVETQQQTEASTASPTSSSITPSTSSISSNFDVTLEAGDDQTLILPKSQLDVTGRVLFKSNRTEISKTVLTDQNWNLIWSLKSSSNGAQVAITSDDNVPSHMTAKQLSEGIYQFEFKLIDEHGIPLAIDEMKVEVVPARTTSPPLLVRVDSPVTVRLPQQVTKLRAMVEPSSREVTYEWTYMKDGPVTPTLSNTDKSDLFVSNLRPGDYSFQLRVADTLGHEQTKVVRVLATGEPIEARVTNAREIVFWPSNDVILDGTPSIVEPKTNVQWSLVSTDSRQNQNDIEIVSPRSLKTRVSNLRIGQYKFQLNLVTVDEQHLSKTEVLVIVYAQNGQPPKIHIDVETPNVNVFNNLLILNASKTTADYGIARWHWIKSPSSPALGHFINNSDNSPIAYLTSLIEGQYMFFLQVVDDRQQTGEMNVSVRVDGIPESENLIEILFSSKTYLLQQTLDNLLVQIRVFLIDIFPNIRIDLIGITKESILLIKGKDTKTNAIIAPKLIADHLRTKIKPLRAASNMNILSINTFLCQSNCSNHGTCDHATKRCACNRYYMENLFKSIVYQEPNCDFLIHYFVLISLGGSILGIAFCWLCLCCCLRWRRRRYLLQRRKRIRYQLLNENEDDDEQNSNNFIEKGKNKFRSSKKNQKGKSSTIVISASDESDENGEQTLYDKPLLATKDQSNSSKSRHLKVSVQDGNGSPMVRNNNQSPTATDTSVA